MHLQHFRCLALFFLIANLFTQSFASHRENSAPLIDLEQRYSQQDKKLKTLEGSIETRLGALQVEIHFPLHSYQWAVQVLAILHRDAARLVDYFDWLPKDPVHFTLVSEAKSANGFASAFPRNTIGLHRHPPTGRDHLSSNPDFQRALVLHELTHILHMDQSRGFPKMVRSVFGAIGKWNGITPRWFSEGIAVWAETYFTNGGRLKDKALDYQLKTALSRPDACRDVGCLDNPNHYPYGSLPYWAGAHFIQFLEDQKKGSASCLLAQNSNSVPFFLNDAFRICLGATANELYFRFTREYLKIPPSEELKAVRSLKFGEHDLMLESGAFLIGQKFHHVQRTEKKTELVVIDVVKNQELQRRRFDYPLMKLLKPSVYDAKKNRFIIGTSDHHNEGEVQLWWGVNADTYAIDRIAFPGGASEIYRLSDQRFAGLVFDRGAWELRVWDREIKDRKKSLKKLLRLSEGVDLFYPTIIEKEKRAVLIVQFAKENQNGLLEIDLEGAAPVKEIFTTEKRFQLLNARDGLVFLSTDEGLQTLGAQEIGLPANLRGNIAALWWQDRDDQSGIALYADAKKGGELKLAMLSLRDRENNLFARDFKTPELANQDLTKTDLRSYPGLRHFRPHYWSFGFGGNEYLTRYDIATSVNDPFNRHTLSLTGSSYSEISKSGGSAFYTYKPNKFFTTGFVEKAYTVRGAGRSTDTFESYGLSFGANTIFSRWSYLPVIFASSDRVDDFISSRESQSYGVRQLLQTTGLFHDSFWQLSSFQMEHYRQKTAGFKEFPAHRYKWDNVFRLSEPLKFHTNFAFSQLQKKGLASGVIYGGGVQALYNLGGFHEFYGLEYGDLISNRISTARAQFDWRFYQSYKGNGFVPLYLKSTHLLLGADYAHSSNIFVNNGFIRDNKITSFHAGLNFKMDVFYTVPLNIETVWAQVQNPEGQNKSQFLMLLKGELFP